jgi:hypothetical protein
MNNIVMIQLMYKDYQLVPIKEKKTGKLQRQTYPCTFDLQNISFLKNCLSIMAKPSKNEVG